MPANDRCKMQEPLHPPTDHLRRIKSTGSGATKTLLVPALWAGRLLSVDRLCSWIKQVTSSHDAGGDNDASELQDPRR